MTTTATSLAATATSLTRHIDGSSEFTRSPPEVLGTCVVYLGGLNYFFRVDERVPIVSRIGTELGRIHVTIDPFVAPPRANGTRDTTLFEPYEPPHEDKPEDQVYNFMDRTLEYRITLHEITGLTLRKHTTLALRYNFYREPSRQTEPLVAATASHRPTALRVDHVSRHIVDVTEPFATYISGQNLLIDVLAWA